MTRILAVVPAYQEAPRVGRVVDGARTYLPVLVVDDGSTDDTAAAAETAGATVIVQRPNAGKGAALRAGFGWALEHGYDAVLTLDADGQHDPAEIPRFTAAFAGGAADLVVGRRDFRRMPPLRRVSNVVGGWAISWVAGRPIPDNQSGYRLLSRRLMEAVAVSDEHGFEFEIEMITTCIRRGYVLAWVPIRTIYAGEPSHIRPWKHFTSFVAMVRRTRREIRRD